MNGNVVAANNVFAGSLSLSTQYTVAGAITYIGTLGSTLTTANTNSIGTFLVQNNGNVGGTLVAVGTGRTGVTGGVTNQTQAFGVFDSAGTSFYDYGWTPEIQDAKSFSFIFNIAANSSVTFDVRGAKTNSGSNLGMTMQIIVSGVRN